MTKSDVDAIIAKIDHEESFAPTSDVDVAYDIGHRDSVTSFGSPLITYLHASDAALRWATEHKRRSSALPGDIDLTTAKVLKWARAQSNVTRTQGPWATLINRYGSELERWAALARERDDIERMALDVEYVMKRLERLYTVRQAKIWMESSNSRLGARPIDVIAMESAERVIGAVNAAEQNAY